MCIPDRFQSHRPVSTENPLDPNQLLNTQHLPCEHAVRLPLRSPPPHRHRPLPASLPSCSRLHRRYPRHLPLWRPRYPLAQPHPMASSRRSCPAPHGPRHCRRASAARTRQRCREQLQYYAYANDPGTGIGEFLFG